MQTPKKPENCSQDTGTASDLAAANRLELLAPAGDFASLQAAIQAGADSVYFGIEGLNMRSHSARNFALSDIPKIVEICAQSGGQYRAQGGVKGGTQGGVKSYLALNTIIFDSEIALVKDILVQAKAAGISAIIASDAAVMQMANSLNLSVHLSTQLNISNAQALKHYAPFADVVVLARELDLGQVRAIFDQINQQKLTGPAGELIKIEMFCHGALCMASSGRCFMSLHLNNNSANRGACWQSCRRSYIAHDIENGQDLQIDGQYILSPKDLKTIHFLAQMVEAGVRVFKIEGRARSADYVATTVACYREALDAVENGGYTATQIEAWDKRLARVFNRGFWDGYYLGQKLGERTAFYDSAATVKKVFLGKCINYFTKIEVAEFILQGGDLAVGDQILIIGQTSGVYESTVGELVVGGQLVRHAAKGSDVTFVTSKRIRRYDKLYKLVSRQSDPTVDPASVCQTPDAHHQ